jgi:hypothetical protein
MDETKGYEQQYITTQYKQQYITTQQTAQEDKTERDKLSFASF